MAATGDKDWERIQKELKVIGDSRILFRFVDENHKNSAKSKGLAQSGTDNKATVKEIDHYMWILDGGSKNTPARPWFRNALPRIEKELSNFTEIGVQKVIDGKWTGADFMDALGYWCVGIFVESIVKGNWEPNADSTIKSKKGRSKPLVDTGTALRSLGFLVYKR